MKKLKQRFDRFCYRNRDKGIPNLMLYICLGSAIVAFAGMINGGDLLYQILRFDKAAILRGEVWRLFSWLLTEQLGNGILSFLFLYFFYRLGNAVERSIGTLKMNLFYLTGVVMMDIYCMIFGGYADVYYLNLSLFLSYATMFPNAQFLLFFIIPVKAWIFALLDLVLVLFGLVAYPFPANLFSVISLANYFLFFGKDVLNVIPLSWRINTKRLFKKKPKGAKVVPFPNAGSYEATTASVKEPYTHKCTVCGRTDISNPELEFRYCSRYKGYHCYCIEHINNHEHIEE